MDRRNGSLKRAKENRRKRLKSNYDLARSLGYSADEARVLMAWSRSRIIGEAIVDKKKPEGGIPLE